MKTIKMNNRSEIPNNFSDIVELSNGTKIWFLNGKLHRVDGPACEYSNGAKEWYLNGFLHRVDGPAYEHVNGEKCWYLNNQLHREDGPAVEHPDGENSYWINGKKIKDKNAYWLLFNIKKLKDLV